MTPEERITELELRFMAQQALLDELSRQLTALNGAADRNQARLDRLESQTAELSREVFPPPNEKPPHY